MNYGRSTSINASVPPSLLLPLWSFPMFRNGPRLVSLPFMSSMFTNITQRRGPGVYWPSTSGYTIWDQSGMPTRFSEIKQIQSSGWSWATTGCIYSVGFCFSLFAGGIFSMFADVYIAGTNFFLGNSAVEAGGEEGPRWPDWCCRCRIRILGQLGINLVPCANDLSIVLLVNVCWLWDILNYSRSINYSTL